MTENEAIASTTAEEIEEQLEYKHYLEVRAAFVEYSNYARSEVDRLVRHLSRVPKHLAARLSRDLITQKTQGLLAGIEKNQLFLDRIVQAQDHMGRFAIPDAERDLPAVRAKRPRVSCNANNISKMKSTLHQCVRDWTAEGEQERGQCYGPILEELQRMLPVTPANRNRQKVLVPGSGLGRLALEIACKGYAAQGNEFSYFMLFVSNYILNHTEQARELSICPYIDVTSNIVNVEDMIREIQLPDVLPAEAISRASQQIPRSHPVDFSMSAGEWLDLYKDQVDEWDSVVTCFFLDTAPVVMEYVEAIHRMLKPGGVWINLGPALYHWANMPDHESDERFFRSVELSWEEIRHVLSTYSFKLVKEERRECLYTCDQRSMMRTVYHCIQFTVVKEAAEPVSASNGA